MTLIASFASPSVGFVGISDAIVSHRWGGEPPVVRLPLRAEGFRHRAGDRVISGLAQKSVIFGRTLMQWSGSVDVARKLVRSAASLTNQGEQPISQQALFANCGLADRDLDTVRITYHFALDDMHISKWQWRCFVKKVGDTELWYQGSGVVDYFWNTDVAAPAERPPQEVLIGEALSRATTHLLVEAASNERLDEMFGGWLEFSEKQPGGFGKLPYAVKLWRVNNKREIIGYDPFLFCWYIGDHLIVCRLDFVEHDGAIKARNGLFPVEDFLGRPAPADASLDPQYDPYMVAHFILNVDGGKPRSIVTFKYEDYSGFHASVSREKGFDWSMTDEFREGLHNSEGPTWTVNVDNTPE